MKILVFTPTCTPIWSTQTATELLGNRRVPFVHWIYSFFQAGKGGFSFGFIAPVGDIHTKEVAVAKEGINLYLHCSKIVSQLFIQRGVSK